MKFIQGNVVKKTVGCVLGCSLLTMSYGADGSWAPVSKVKPAQIKGMERSSILLNGEWEFDFSPKQGWDKQGYAPESGWKVIAVPGECVMQGYGIEHDKPVLYRKVVKIPLDFSEKEVRLRFDGVYSYARLYVNGEFVRDHHGGFTRWEADISPWVKPGEDVEIKLEVTDKKDDISYASGYAHHPIGGILRNVTLYALPKNHWEDVRVETFFDDQYKNARLKVSATPVFATEGEVTVILKDKEGTLILEEKKSVTSADSGKSLVWEFPIESPKHWTAETPYLYDLSVSTSGNSSMEVAKKVGFREIKIRGNEMLVNGNPVKLRGACRHDIHPTLGRVGLEEYDKRDAALFRSSNMNFVRTSHYPPTEEFLNYCDEYGVYVECETAVCFVNMWVHTPYAALSATQDKEEYKARYLSQLQEMMRDFRNHPSILFWSIGNESRFGSNFEASYSLAKELDSRPVIFSYPGTVPEDKKAFDLLSFHYPETHGNLRDGRFESKGFEHPDFPSLFDEWTHVPCYTYETLRQDPNIREFWAASMDKMWENLMKSKGGLGGAIWCYVDETFAIPEMKMGTDWWRADNVARQKDVSFNRVAGYGEWGIVDVWRREKPEFWATKKAYSPIRLLTKELPLPEKGKALSLDVQNRFDHVDFKDLTIQVQYLGKTETLSPVDLAPRTKGKLSIPARDWSDKLGEKLIVKFLDPVGRIIDMDAVSLGKEQKELTVREKDYQAKPIKIEDTPEQIILKGERFTLPIQKATGLMTQVKSGNDMIIERGPYLNLYINYNKNTGAESRDKSPNFIASDKDWVKKDFSIKESSDGVRIFLSGTFKEVEVVYDILVTPYGEITVDYDIVKGPEGWVRECGIMWEIARHHQKIEWDRQSYWTYYPKGSYGEPKGKADFYVLKKMAYREDPKQDWDQDTANYYYFPEENGAPNERFLTNRARGMKENVYSYIVGHDYFPRCLGVFSPEAKLACRVSKSKEEKLFLHVNNVWDYPEIAWGCYARFIPARENAKGKSNLNIFTRRR